MAADHDAARGRADSDSAPDGDLRLDTRPSDAAAAILTFYDHYAGHSPALDRLELCTGAEVTVTVVAQRRAEYRAAAGALCLSLPDHTPTPAALGAPR